MNDLISIIVPVYNSSAFIYDCIQSILQQTYPYFELILVDDGSQDRSRCICREISSMDSRILFITQDHKGVSAARNRAINAAKGKYLFFLDSDDAIHPCLLEILHIILSKTHAVLAASEYNFIKDRDCPKSEIAELNSQYFNDYIHLDNQTSLNLFTQGLTNILYGTGGIMIHTDTPSLLFDETLTNGEDTKFIYQLLLSGADVIILHKKWYYYRKHKKNSSKKISLESCRNMYKCESYIRDCEMERHRNRNAIIKEQIILIRISEWYIESRHTKNKRLCKYLKKLVIREKRSNIFLQTDASIKIEIFLLFHCFPLHWVFKWFSHYIIVLLKL